MRNSVKRAALMIRETLGEDEAACLIDGAAGIYIPKMFAERFDLLDDYPELSSPENEVYYDVWDELLNEISDILANYGILMHKDSEGLFVATEDYAEEEFSF